MLDPAIARTSRAADCYADCCTSNKKPKRRARFQYTAQNEYRKTQPGQLPSRTSRDLFVELDDDTAVQLERLAIGSAKYVSQPVS